MTPEMTNYIQYVKNDTANGEGVRNSLFVAGCSIRCKGCWNPESWNPKNGTLITTEFIQQVVEDLRPSYIQGLSLLGGEPFDSPDTISDLITHMRATYGESKNIWCWSGYTLEQLQTRPEAEYALSEIDVLVAGPFVLAERDLTLKFRGSRNQEVLYLREQTLASQA